MPEFSKISRYRRHFRRFLAIVAAIVAIVELSAAAIALIVDGFTWTFGPLRISLHEPFKPLLVGLLSAILSICLRDRGTADESGHENSVNLVPGKSILAVVSLVSAALMLLQTSFTRLIGYKLFYHFVFLAIALALLGLGAAGAIVATNREPRNLTGTLRGWLAVLVVLVPISFLLMANPPITTKSELPIKLLGADAVQYLLWCSVFMVALNFAGGVVLTYAFRRFSANMGRLYCYDLIGAAVGCLLAVALMKYGSPPLAFVFAAPLAFVALLALVRSEGSVRERAGVIVLGGVGVVLAVFVFAGPERLRSFENFERATGPRASIIKYEWNHIIRTDHVPGAYVLDGEARTDMIRWDEAQQGYPVTDPVYDLVKQQPRVAVIGFGGGAQVAEARRARASHIVAIDINPSIYRWVVNEDREMNLGLFASPEIELVNADGRHAVRSYGSKFDVLVMHAIDTYAATAAGAYALSENFLYTKEAIRDYLNTLEPGGVMSIERWLFNPPRENLRLFVTALEALKENGAANPERHLIVLAPLPDWEVLREGKARVWGHLMFSNKPFDDDQIAKVRAKIQRLNWSVLYAPGGNENTPFRQYVKTADKRAFLRDYPYLISPVSDASPYMFQFYNPLDKSAYQVDGDWQVTEIYQSSAVLLMAAFVISVIASLVIIIAPLALFSKSLGKHRLSLRDVVFFVCLGIGFMAFEVPLAQILSLYLGHPVYGFSVVLVALLVSSGVGSLLSGRLGLERWKMCALTSGLLVLATLFMLSFVHRTIHFPAPARFGLALLLVAAYGVPMGFPLALGVREVGRINTANVAWGWAINGAASVVGSCLVMVVMVFLGTRHALVIGAACYAVAALVGVSRVISPTRSTAP